MRVAGLCATAVLFLASALSNAAQEAAEYILGPEDVVTVTVLRHPEFSGDFLVPKSGTIQLPAVGDVTVQGMSLRDLSALVLKRLKPRLLKPEVSVTLKVARILRIYVLGDIKFPGVIDLKPRWRLAESLSAAGGLLPGTQSSDVHVTLERTGEAPRVRTLDEALGAFADEFLVKPGDVLRIESIDMVPVYVTGSVKLPGLFRLRSDNRGILAAISQAGGILPEASASNVKVVRLNGTEESVNLAPFLIKKRTFDGTSEPSVKSLPLLGAGDMVLIPESRNRIAILGLVGKPGYYSLPDGQTYFLADALALASGGEGVPGYRGRLSRVGLVRREGGKDVRTVYDLGKYLKTGLSSQNPQIFPGDVIYVPESDRVEISTVLNSISSIALLWRGVKQ